MPDEGTTYKMQIQGEDVEILGMQASVQWSEHLEHIIFYNPEHAVPCRGKLFRICQSMVK